LFEQPKETNDVSHHRPHYHDLDNRADGERTGRVIDQALVSALVDNDDEFRRFQEDLRRSHMVTGVGAQQVMIHSLDKRGRASIDAQKIMVEDAATAVTEGLSPSPLDHPNRRTRSLGGSLSDAASRAVQDGRLIVRRCCETGQVLNHRASLTRQTLSERFGRCFVADDETAITIEHTPRGVQHGAVSDQSDGTKQTARINRSRRRTSTFPSRSPTNRGVLSTERFDKNTSKTDVEHYNNKNSVGTEIVDYGENSEDEDFIFLVGESPYRRNRAQSDVGIILDNKTHDVTPSYTTRHRLASLLTTRASFSSDRRSERYGSNSNVKVLNGARPRHHPGTFSQSENGVARTTDKYNNIFEDLSSVRKELMPPPCRPGAAIASRGEACSIPHPPAA